MHLGKTKAKFNSHAKPSPVIVDGKIIEEVDSYVYLGKYIPRDGTLFPEVKRRFVLGCAAFRRAYSIKRISKFNN